MFSALEILEVFITDSIGVLFLVLPFCLPSCPFRLDCILLFVGALDGRQSRLLLYIFFERNIMDVPYLALIKRILALITLGVFHS